MPGNAAGLKAAIQFIRSPGKVDANYHASVIARSCADFDCKFEIVLEEADESHYWLKIIKELQIKTSDGVSRVIIEENELTANFEATDSTTTANIKNKTFYLKL